MKDPVWFTLLWAWIGMISFVFYEFVMYHIKYKKWNMKDGYSVYLSTVFKFLVSMLGGPITILSIGIVLFVEVNMNDIKLFNLTNRR